MKVASKIMATESMLGKDQENGLRKVRIRMMLVLPFVFQTIAAVGLVGYLSFRNGYDAVQNLAKQLQTQISYRVDQHLDSFLANPPNLNELNLAAVDLDLLDLQNSVKTGKYFWKQMQIYNVGYINFGDTKGNYIGVERLDSGGFHIVETRADRVKPGEKCCQQYVYEADSKGDRAKLQEIIPDYNYFEEGWYTKAAEQQKPIWSDIYQWEDKPEVLSISSSYPVFDTQKRFLGVIGVDHILSQVSDFLKKLEIAKSGLVFIWEQDGSLVASSSAEQPYILVKEKPQRLNVLNSQTPLIQLTAKHLLGQAKNFSHVQTTQEFQIFLNGEKYFVSVVPWQDQQGLNWLIGILVPESDFMGQIYQNTRITILLCLVALGLAIWIGIYTSRLVTRPVLRISEASNALAQGRLDQHVTPSPIFEIDTLAKSFNGMAGQLKRSFETLEAKNEELRLAEENYRSIFENASEGIFQSSPEGRFINVNPAFAKIYGYDSPAEMIASITHISEQLYVDLEKRTEFKEMLDRHGSVKASEYRCYCKDGTIIWTQIDARSVKDSAGETLYYEGMVQDITERKRREDELRRQLEELKIEIDQTKRDKEVAMLTESTYFQEVQQEMSEVDLDEFWS